MFNFLGLNVTYKDSHALQMGTPTCNCKGGKAKINFYDRSTSDFE